MIFYGHFALTVCFGVVFFSIFAGLDLDLERRPPGCFYKISTTR